MNELIKLFQPTITRTGLTNFGLSLVSSAPSTTLKGVVHSYLQIQAERPTLYPVIPDGTQSIFISPHGGLIGGAQIQTRDIQLHEAGAYFGIRFYTGALRHFFNIDLSEITNQFVGGEYLPCKDFSDLYELIYQENCYYKRASVCENWLLQHYKPQVKNRFDQALDLIYQSSGNIRINGLAHRVAWSSRHLNRIFQRYTGLNTKTFSKIVRMQQACSQLTLSQRSALDSGFFDQSHLIKDFRQHLLSTPTDFSSRFMSDFYNQ